MKTLLRCIAFTLLSASWALGQVNVQKTSGTNAVTGNLVIGEGKSLTATGTGNVTATNLAAGATGAGLTLSGGEKVTGTIGSSGTFGRSDAGVEIQAANTPTFSLFATTAPGAAATQDLAIIGTQYDGGSNKVKLGSMGWFLGTATSNNSKGTLYLNTTSYSSGVASENPGLVLYGGTGMRLFTTNYTTGPGANILDVPGVITVGASSSGAQVVPLIVQNGAAAATNNDVIFTLRAGSNSLGWNFRAVQNSATTGDSDLYITRNTAANPFRMTAAATDGLLTLGNGTVTIGGQIITATSTPASAGAAGTAGTITWDASYIYVCVATNTWKRVAIATW